ncbi:MAG: YicC/YloC family endoribonuclease, partial [bacterium]
ALEPQLRELVGQHVARGKLTVHVNFEEPMGSSRRYPINEGALKRYHQQLEQVRRRLKIERPIDMSDLIGLPEVATSVEEAPDLEVIWESLAHVTKRALQDLVRMRKREGNAIAADMRRRLKTIKDLTRKIICDSAGCVEQQRQKMRDRIEELLASPLPDQTRLEEELAIMADKTDITEECTRLISHIDQYQRTFKSTEPVGKKLNFLLQEFNREANTISSKASDLVISRSALAIKEEVEKLREQIQNIE